MSIKRRAERLEVRESDKICKPVPCEMCDISHGTDQIEFLA